MAKTVKVAPGGIPIQGRNAAYIARNRAALVQAASEVFARIGPEATIEEIAAQAGVSVSTIYAHFPSKLDLFATFSREATTGWQTWVDARLSGIDDPLQRFVAIPRLLFRQKLTHPLYAEVARKNFPQMSRNRYELTTAMRAFVTELLKAKILAFDHPQSRLENYAACIFSTYEKYVSDENFTEEECDISLEVALSLFNISPAQAKKLAHGELPDLTL